MSVELPQFVVGGGLVSSVKRVFAESLLEQAAVGVPDTRPLKQPPGKELATDSRR